MSDKTISCCSNDTICVSGFVGQGSPDKILEAIGDRYDDTGSPHSLTLIFGGEEYKIFFITEKCFVIHR